MNSIAVIHPNLEEKGGAEAVCMNILEALQPEYDITLYTCSQPPITQLNRFFGTSVSGIQVKNIFSPLIGDFISTKDMYKLKKSILSRTVSNDQDAYELVISTKNEVSVSIESVQYVHFPDSCSNSSHNPNRFVRKLYEDCVHLCQPDSSQSTYLSNSKWTAKVIESVHGQTPTVVYPPVLATDFEPRCWKDKENGFVSIGRIDPSKNTHTMLDIIEELRAIGHQVHIHLIGDVVDSQYGQSVEERAEGADWISLEGSTTRSELVQLVEKHRYGIHGKHKEHFGIAVAELVAGGAIPFVHNSGGQVEIVHNEHDLMYEGVSEAVAKIDQVLVSEGSQMTLLDALPNVEEEFGQKRFKQEIIQVVEERL